MEKRIGDAGKGINAGVTKEGAEIKGRNHGKLNRFVPFKEFPVK